MKRRKKLIKILLVSPPLLVALFICLSFLFNQNAISPDDEDIILLKSFFGSQFVIREFEDVLEAQNLALKKIPHGERIWELDALSLEFIVDQTLGPCYEMSFLLQKLLLANGLKVRPTYIFFGKDNTRWIDFFRPGIESHNIFETKINGEWVVVETKIAMTNKMLSSLDNYFDSGGYAEAIVTEAMINKSLGIVPSHAKYIRHVFSRNSTFIAPWYLPDIY